MCVVQSNVMKRVRNGRRKWLPSLLQKGERGRCLHLLWSELSWKRDTELRHQSSHGQTQTRRKETETHQMCPHCELLILEPPWLFVWFIQQCFFRGLLRNKPLPSLLLITLLSTLDNPINYSHTNEFSCRTHKYTPCIYTHLLFREQSDDFKFCLKSPRVTVSLRLFSFVPSQIFGFWFTLFLHFL